MGQSAPAVTFSEQELSQLKISSKPLPFDAKDERQHLAMHVMWVDLRRNQDYLTVITVLAIPDEKLTFHVTTNRRMVKPYSGWGEALEDFVDQTTKESTNVTHYYFEHSSRMSEARSLHIPSWRLAPDPSSESPSVMECWKTLLAERRILFYAQEGSVLTRSCVDDIRRNQEQCESFSSSWFMMQAVWRLYCLLIPPKKAKIKISS